MIISSRIYISFFSSFPRSKPPSTALPPLVATRISFEERRKEKRGRKEGRKKGGMDNEGVNRAWKDSRREGEERRVLGAFAALSSRMFEESRRKLTSFLLPPPCFFLSLVC